MSVVTESERKALREATADLLADMSSGASRRAAIENPDPFDRVLWSRMSQDLGLTGIGIPEEYGGGGGDALDLAVVLEEVGAALACVPYLSSVAVAAQALVACGDQQAMADLLPGIAAGTTVATFAFDGALGCWDGGPAAVQAAGGPAGWALSGSLPRVIDGCAADLLVVVADTAAGPAPFAVDLGAPEVARTPLATLDLTRGVASVKLERATARAVGTPGDGAPLDRASDLAVTALAAEQVGGAQAALDMAVAYAKQRVQFGRPIGSFQAIKHMCTDMLVLVESARSAAWHAADVAAAGGDLPTAAAVAGSFCSDAYGRVAADALHVHGGIGFTYEHDAHLYVRRATAARLMLGDPALHRRRLAERWPPSDA